MSTTLHTLEYGTQEIGYELRLSGRKSLEIAVHPDRRVVVKAPADRPPELIAERVRRRARWIARQLQYFRQFEPRTPPRRYVGGESHLYLGRKYRLRISPDFTHRGVLLKDGRFQIPCEQDDPRRARLLLERWYRRRSLELLPVMLERCWEVLELGEHARPRLMIRQMNTRWGSISAGGRLTLNLKLIQAPKECVEYVVMHELCHLEHAGHGAAFRRRLSRAMPDWQRRKQRLERTLA